jgi:hypothetical protein
VVLWCTGLTVLIVTTPLWGTRIWKVVHTRKSSNYICEFVSHLILHAEKLTATLKNGMVGERSIIDAIGGKDKCSAEKNGEGGVGADDPTGKP